jgi:hypothetical protein
MKKALLLVTALCVMGFAGIKTVPVKTMVKADTTMKIDTVYFLSFDTTKYTQTVKDTVLAGKIDSVKTSSKPVQIKKTK